MSNRDVSPDDSLLKHIFNEKPSTSIFLQDWDKCVFKADFGVANALDDNVRPSCVVRLEAEDAHLASFGTIAAMQQIAADCIPGLVPKILQVGIAANEQGRRFQFCVMELAEGVTLHDAWDQMTSDNQSSIVNELVEALQKLHAVRLSDDIVQNTLRRALGDQEAKVLDKMVMGGPLAGFVHDGHALLTGILQRRSLRKPFCDVRSTADPDPKDLIVQSIFEHLGSATVKEADMENWATEAVFCHNDLTPRNLLVRSVQNSDNQAEPRYKLSAIIDWELAGFYPPSYELSLQDTYLGGGNSHASLYLLLKQRLNDVVPMSPSQVSLLQAMELIYESQQEMLAQGNNIPAHMQRRFRERLGLSRDKHPYMGWTPSSEDGPREFSQIDFQKLEDEVVAEMVARRQKKN
ncbi:uncharacterized protein TRIVIDRAFT_229003 [Trichoderma virens Gv29-8]|uniref:Aminoglycoside phosphotransferase domain-containing protein n=1 Tax=Hypocrea virens (strain Gv29-8 / FGSC 10586) TaxID=413071 RepID=G9MFF0_HYPVG|nr:uncharacterized protein TRIVIDRAFT_229003 [Trichoderma virens Gv29-8]EHK27116.1 hypothetical protein TRIVIDRAFT_229003 [Trichoderma virens Gv29-8]UKZ57569.1 hypothetical protein TrVGV298_011428 [Trichoderma virens]